MPVPSDLAIRMTKAFAKAVKPAQNRVPIKALLEEISKKHPEVSLDTACFACQYGSYVYETNTEKSDFDVIIVSDAVKNGEFEYTDDKISCKAFSVNQFKHLIKEHRIDILECLWLRETCRIKRNINFTPDFTLDLPTLRESISKKASHSFVKAKKKLTVEEDYDEYVGLKSLFHSFRIIIFGQQIATSGCITNYWAANHYYESIFSHHNADWDTLKKIYKPLYNMEMSKFRKVAPKQ